MAQFQFDATQVEPDAGRRGPAPKGWYTLVLKKSPIEPTQGGGARINAMFQIHDGDYKGGVVFHGFNIKNDSEKAVQISAKQLSALGHATGILKIQATDQWHDIPFRARLKVTEEDGYDPKNEITAFAHINDPAAVDRVSTTTAKPAGASAAPQAAQSWQAPPAAQVLQPSAAAPVPAQAAWTPPAAAQPWSPPVEAVQQQAQQVAAPAPAPTAAPAWNPNPNVSTAAPVLDAQVQQSIPAPSQTAPPVQQQPAFTATPSPAPVTEVAPKPTASAPAEQAAPAAAIPPWLAQAQ